MQVQMRVIRCCHSSIYLYLQTVWRRSEASDCLEMQSVDICEEITC